MTKKLQVVHLNASSGGGAFVAAQRLSKALNQYEGVESNHLVFDGVPGPFKLWANNWLLKKIAFLLHAIEKLDFLRYEKSKSIRFAFSHALTGVNILKHPLVKNADVIHLHWVNKGFLSFDSLEKIIHSGKRIVWTCHDLWPFTGGCYHPRGCDHFIEGCGNCQYLISPSQNDLSRAVFKSKQDLWGNGQIQFVTPSNWLKQTSEKSALMKHNAKITTIPNCVDIQFFRAATDLEMIESREMFGLNPNLTTIMFSAANLKNTAKGINEFIQVCNQLVELNIEFQIMIIGDKRDMEISFPVKTVFLGFINDATILRKAYWSATVYVTTSHEENLPTTIMESLSCGVPVCAFEVGGIPEMIVQSKTGMLCKKLDVNAMSSQIIELLELIKDQKDGIRANCVEFAANHYSDSVIAREYMLLYN
jgi:glycosyltransferase involved in cell wall biosynthesis